MLQKIFSGNPHNNYSNHQKRSQISKVIDQISNGNQSIYRISKNTCIPESTLRNWKKCLTIDPEWRPWKKNHGSGHRIFTDEEECAIKEYIVNCFINPGFIFTNEDFIDVAMNAYLTKHPDEIDIDEKNNLWPLIILFTTSKREITCRQGRYMLNEDRMHQTKK